MMRIRNKAMELLFGPHMVARNNLMRLYGAKHYRAYDSKAGISQVFTFKGKKYGEEGMVSRTSPAYVTRLHPSLVPQFSKALEEMDGIEQVMNASKVAISYMLSQCSNVADIFVLFPTWMHRFFVDVQGTQERPHISDSKVVQLRKRYHFVLTRLQQLQVVFLIEGSL